VEKTLFIVKPHAVERGLVGTFLERFERMGLQIVALKVISGDKALWERFYPSDESWLENVGSKTADDCKVRGIDLKSRLGTSDVRQIGRSVKQWLVEHMSSGPAVAAVLGGNDVQSKVRLTAGATLPNKAAPGTIRFDYSADSPSLANDEKRPVFNLVHASDPTEKRDGLSAASYEISLLFPEIKN
jgi:nucleoside-diphosphate kinase